MNTFQLVCFLTAAEHLNFTKAAEVLHVTQPAVGQQIHSLENELGVKLFTRTTRSVKLTREGKRFISDANQIVSISERAKKRFASTPTDEIEHLAIGCESFPFMYQMMAVLENLKEKRPGIADNPVSTHLSYAGRGRTGCRGRFSDTCRRKSIHLLSGAAKNSHENDLRQLSCTGTAAGGIHRGIAAGTVGFI